MLLSWCLRVCVRARVCVCVFFFVCVCVCVGLFVAVSNAIVEDVVVLDTGSGFLKAIALCGRVRQDVILMGDDTKPANPTIHETHCNL